MDYICYTLLNEDADQSVLRDARETREQLSIVAANLQYCRNPRLRALEYRAITFRRHRYVMLYRIVGNEVYVEAIYHQLQDYENTFANELI
ncbi:MAG: type II toxin-antitoxin system RelE/ParE family toxin [Clostridiales bacterium]|nr:type II toxin-antitoxin system RelE/ParE family toxin [Clostridiales bacterium]